MARNKAKQVIENIIFSSKWILIPFLFVLILSLVIYAYFDVKEFIEYVLQLNNFSKDDAMLMVIKLIDITMISNLCKMIITGSYTSFINKEHGNSGEQVSSGMLKVKMATSLIGVTAINLLEKSMSIKQSLSATATNASWTVLFQLGFVHIVFLLSAVVLVYVDRLHEKSEQGKEELKLREHDLKIKHNEHDLSKAAHKATHTLRTV